MLFLASIAAVLFAGYGGLLAYRLPPGGALLAAGEGGFETRPYTEHVVAAAGADEPWVALPVGQFGGGIGTMAVDEGAAGTSGAGTSGAGMSGAGTSGAGADVVWIGHGPRVAAVVVRDPARPVLSGRTPWLDGFVRGLAVRDGFGVAIVSWPNALYTLDLRDHAAPRVLGRVAGDGLTSALDLRDGFAFVVRFVTGDDAAGNPTSRRTVAVIDVRDPAAPRVVTDDLYSGSTDWIRDIRVVGGRLAVAASSQVAPFERYLDLFDIANGAAPRRLARHPLAAACRFARGTPASPRDVLWAMGDGIEALDVADAAAPRSLHRWGGAQGDDELCHRGTHLFVRSDGSPFAVVRGTWGSAGLFAMAETPDEWGRRAGYGFGISAAPGAALIGDHAVLANARGDVLAVDTRRLTMDREPPETVVAGRLELLGEVSAVAVDDAAPDNDRLYAVVREGGFRILSTRAPAAPRIVGGAADRGHHVRAHAAAGLVAVSYDGELDASSAEADVYDAVDAAHPAHQHHFKRGNFTHILPRPGGAWAVNGSDRAGIRFRADTLTLAPLADPEGPLQRDIVFPHTMSDADTDGNVLVAVGVDGSDAPVGPVGLDVWDIADPSRPARSGRLPGVALNRSIHFGPLVELRDGTAVVASIETADAGGVTLSSRLSVVDLGDNDGGAGGSEDGGPRLRGSVVVSLTISALAAAEGYVFAPGYESVRRGAGYTISDAAVLVVDVRDADAPRVAGRLEQGGVSGLRDGIAVLGGRVFVAAGDAGVWVFEPPLDRPQPRSRMWLAMPWVGVRVGDLRR